MQLRINGLPFGRFDEINEPPIESKGLSQEGILNLLEEDETPDDKDKDEDKGELDLDEDEDKKPKKKDKEGLDLDEDEDEDEDKEKDDEDKEDEEELKEFDLIAPHKKKEILKEFPGLDKKFPFVFQAYYGYQQYVEVFPTVEDAKEAAESVEALNKFERSVMGGTTEDILKAVKPNEKAFAKIVDDYLPSLYRVDPGAAEHIVTNVYKNMLFAAQKQAKDSNNEELETAVKTLAGFLFPGITVTPATRLSKEDPKEKNEISEERRAFAMEKYEHAQTDLQTKVDNVVMSTINANIDPKSSMSAFEKKHACKEAFDIAEHAMLNDKIFKAQLDRLWKAAYENNYSRSAMENIRRTYLGKAKTVLKAAIRQARIEALKGKGRKQSDDDDDKDRRGHLPVNRHSSGGKTKEDKIEGKRPGETTAQFFAR